MLPEVPVKFPNFNYPNFLIFFVGWRERFKFSAVIWIPFHFLIHFLKLETPSPSIFPQMGRKNLCIPRAIRWRKSRRRKRRRRRPARRRSRRFSAARPTNSFPWFITLSCRRIFSRIFHYSNDWRIFLCCYFCYFQIKLLFGENGRRGRECAEYSGECGRPCLC